MRLFCALFAVFLAACDQAPAVDGPQKSATTVQSNNLVLNNLVLNDVVTKKIAENVEGALLLPLRGQSPLDYLIAHGDHNKGLVAYNKTGEAVLQRSGSFESLDARAFDQHWLIALVNKATQQAELLQLTDQGFGNVIALPKSAAALEAVCLKQDKLGNGFLFLIGEEGFGEQWLVATDGKPLAAPVIIRSLSMPPDAKACRVIDALDHLIVNEETVGFWQYLSGDEAPLVRAPIAMLAPFGEVKDVASGLTTEGNLVALIDAEANELLLMQAGVDTYQPLGRVTLNLQEPEKLSARVQGNGVELLVVDDEGAHRLTLDNIQTSVQTNEAPVIHTISSVLQTAAVPSMGDAADDPAIWTNADDVSQSLVLGTDKKGGLAVYDLNGEMLDYLAVGRLNNVDVRHQVRVGERLIDLAAATHRDNYSVQMFSQVNGKVALVGEIPTPLKDIYGFCMYQGDDGRGYAIANDTSGRFIQYEITDGELGQLSGKKVREWKTNTQPEGCVADDKRHRLFIGEEDVAVWALDARPDAPTTFEQVIAVGEWAKDDIEGLGLYSAEHPYLVVSSQGNDSYLVLDAVPPYKVQGAFRVGINGEKGIDGVSETDGLEVTSANLGGEFSEGLVVLQDGRKRMPEGNQNFKYVSWKAIRESLNLPQ